MNTDPKSATIPNTRFPVITLDNQDSINIYYLETAATQSCMSIYMIARQLKEQCVIFTKPFGEMEYYIHTFVVIGV